MSPFRRISKAFAALRQLGPTQVGRYAWYQLGLKTGYLKRRTMHDGHRINEALHSSYIIRPLFEVPDRDSVAAVLGEKSSMVLAEADEIINGRMRLFGGEPAPLQLRVPGPLKHWTAYGEGIGEDIKDIWEPGRFGWTYPLGRAYYVRGDERYVQAFWNRLDEFLQANPAYLGPHWASAQEVALRLIALTFTFHLLENSPASTPERKERLAEAIAIHARRIPPTLIYARAQNNNHLLSEAAGLYTAGLALPDHPEARNWRETGWRWFIRGLQDQIAPDGTYSQHSTNYHRLMLQLALWVDLLARSGGESFPEVTRARLAEATRWLLSLVDNETGRVPNLGPNDGAYIQPLSTCPFGDYRPVVQAAARAFLGETVFPTGPWDEMSLWLSEDKGQGDRGIGDRDEHPNPDPLSPHILRSPTHSSWAYFRIAHFASRPGHADQLHLDLWWRGLNVARDAGTFRYNASPPWENALAGSAVHNTVTVNGQDQMRRAGRFLWLDWAQGVVEAGERGSDGAWVHLAASQDGYRRLGVTHQREVNACPGGRWVVEDRLLQVAGSRSKVKPASWYLKTFTARLHWLLPDWPWRLVADSQSAVLVVESPYGSVELRMRLGNVQKESRLGACAHLEGAHKRPGYNSEILDECSQAARLQSPNSPLPKGEGPGMRGNSSPTSQYPIGARVHRSQVDGDPQGVRRSHYTLQTGVKAHPELKTQLARAGEVLYGEGQAAQTWGWASPTYGVKVPGLSVAVSLESTLPICLISEWVFPSSDPSSNAGQEGK